MRADNMRTTSRQKLRKVLGLSAHPLQLLGLLQYPLLPLLHDVEVFSRILLGPLAHGAHRLKELADRLKALSIEFTEGAPSQQGRRFSSFAKLHRGSDFQRA